MPAQFITVKKSDPQFLSLLTGSYKADVRPVPIKSYNVGSDDETVTFELLNKSELPRVSKALFVSSLVKYKTFILCIWPFVFLCVSHSQSQIDLQTGLLALLASLLLLSALNIRNDINDHMTGYDRVNIDISPKPISLGWVTAQKALGISNFLTLVSLFAALPVIYGYPQVTAVIGAAAVLFALSYAYKQNIYKSRHIGEFCLWLLSGPLYFVGLSLSMNIELSRRILYYSGIWGLAVLFLIHINNFSHLMTSSQNKIKNTMTKLGFDRAQNFLIANWGLVVFFNVIYFFEISYSALIYSAGLLSAAVYFNYKIKRIISPMGSGLMRMRRLAYYTFTFTVLMTALLQIYLAYGAGL